MTLADLSEKLILDRMERIGRLCVDAAPAFVAAATPRRPMTGRIGPKTTSPLSSGTMAMNGVQTPKKWKICDPYPLSLTEQAILDKLESTGRTVVSFGYKKGRNYGTSERDAALSLEARGIVSLTEPDDSAWSRSDHSYVLELTPEGKAFAQTRKMEK